MSQKRSRRGGYRRIDAPNAALRDLQRRVYHKLLKSRPTHPAATGFVPSRSIIDNAKPHVGQAVVINIDLKDFFPSIKEDRVYQYWESLGWNRQAATVLTNICCYNGCLPQGAPTSPALSNLINLPLDLRLFGLVKKIPGGRYTRYADDLTFSFSRFDTKDRWFIKYVKEIVRDEGYEIQQQKKIRIQRAHQRQSVTGLIVNEKVNLPRSTRRKIRAMQHYRRMGKLPPSQESQLAGYEALLTMVTGGKTAEAD